jgi:hypothetical protein
MTDHDLYHFLNAGDKDLKAQIAALQAGDVNQEVEVKDPILVAVLNRIFPLNISTDERRKHYITQNPGWFITKTLFHMRTTSLSSSSTSPSSAPSASASSSGAPSTSAQPLTGGGSKPIAERVRLQERPEPAFNNRTLVFRTSIFFNGLVLKIITFDTDRPRKKLKWKKRKFGDSDDDDSDDSDEDEGDEDDGDEDDDDDDDDGEVYIDEIQDSTEESPSSQFQRLMGDLEEEENKAAIERAMEQKLPYQKPVASPKSATTAKGVELKLGRRTVPLGNAANPVFVGDPDVTVGIDPGECYPLVATRLDRGSSKRSYKRIKRGFLYRPVILHRKALNEHKKKYQIDVLEHNMPPLSLGSVKKRTDYLKMNARDAIKNAVVNADVSKVPDMSVRDVLFDFYRSGWLLSRTWDSSRAQRKSMNLAVDAILKLAGVNTHSKRQLDSKPNPKVVFAIGLGEFNTRTGLASKHGIILKRFISKASNSSKVSSSRKRLENT